MSYQTTQNNLFSKSLSVTPKKGFVYSNQGNSTQWPQSDVMSTNIIQSGPQNFHALQQSSYSDPLDTTTQQQTNSIAQQSSLSYNYQPTPQNFNVQQNQVIGSNSINLPHQQHNVIGSNQPQSLQTQSGQFQSSLPQTSTGNASNRNQYMGNNTNS